MTANTKFITDTYKYVKRNSSNKKLLKSNDLDDEASTSSVVPQYRKKQNDSEILRQFDMNLHFGPCIGITRLERWQRADKHGLNPSIEVRDLIEQHSDDKKYTECVWKDYVI